MYVLDNKRTLENEFKARGFEHLDFFENIVFINYEDFINLKLEAHSTIVIINSAAIPEKVDRNNQFLSVVQTFWASLILHPAEGLQAGEKKAKDFLNLNTKVLSSWIVPMDEVSWEYLKNQLSFFHQRSLDEVQLRKSLYQFTMDLGEVLESTKLEILKAKKIHLILMPKRDEEIKGLQFFSRYGAGERGSEYTDILQNNHSIYLVMISTQSYLASTSLMGLIQAHKENVENFDPVVFHNEALQEVKTINASKKKPVKADWMVVEFSNVKLQAKVHKQGTFKVVKIGRGEVEESEFNLNKNDKYVFISSGYAQNWEIVQKSDVSQYINEHSSSSNIELVNELFFNIRKDRTSEFLELDASVVSLEVKRNVFRQV
jgi:hypothetical protein